MSLYLLLSGGGAMRVTEQDAKVKATSMNATVEIARSCPATLSGADNLDLRSALEPLSAGTDRA
jgi:hypothetical protein